MSRELLTASKPSSILASQPINFLTLSYELSALSSNATHWLSYELFIRNPTLDPADGVEVRNLFV
jgi:hypothetical protein